MRVPDVKQPAIWRDPAQPLKARADDLIRRMSLAEKVAQLKMPLPPFRGSACRLLTIGTRRCTAWPTTARPVFPEPVGGAASWNLDCFISRGAHHRH